MLLHTWQRLCVAAIASAVALPALAQNQSGARPQPPASGQAEQAGDQPTDPNRSAQPQNPNGRFNSQRRPNRALARRVRRLSDQAIAQWLLTEVQSQVEIGQFAAQHTQNDQVKQFAQQMVTEHQAHAQALQKFVQSQGQGRLRGNRPGQRNPRAQPGANPRTNNPRARRNRDSADRDPVSTVENNNNAGENNAAPPQPGTVGQEENNTDPSQPGAAGQDDPANAPGQPGTRRPGTRQPGSPRTTRQPFRSGRLHNPVIKLKQEIDKQQAKMITKALKETSPKAVDAWYMGEQLLAHMNMKVVVQALQKRAHSQQLKQVLTKAEQDITNHIDKAKQIMESLGDSRQQDSQQGNANDRNSQPQPNSPQPNKQ